MIRSKTLQLAFTALLFLSCGPALLGQSFRCLPTCDGSDGRMFALSGDGFSTLARDRIQLQIIVPGDALAFTIGVFDGETSDGTGYWDFNRVLPLAPATDFQLFEDPDDDGIIDVGAVPIAPFLPISGDVMLDNDWSDFTVSTSGATPTTTGSFSYILEITNPTSLTAAHRFKVRTDSGLELRPQSFAIVGSLSSLLDFEFIYPNYPTPILDNIPATPPFLASSSYDGDWEFSFILPAPLSTFEFWDGDVDFGSLDCSTNDVDDDNTMGSPFLPDWATGTAAEHEGLHMGDASSNPACVIANSFPNATGSPTEDNPELGGVFLRAPSSTYEIVSPDGRIFSNSNPSGDKEWGKFLIALAPDPSLPPLPEDVPDVALDAPLPPGRYTFRIKGLDLSNLVAFRNFVTLLPPIEECLSCKGGVTQMTMAYGGADGATVRVETKDGDVFEAVLNKGDVFSFSGLGDGGKLGKVTDIFVDGELNASIHTSCSKPVGPGFVAGDFVVRDAVSRDNGRICPVEPPPCECEGQVSQLTLRYLGSDAALIQVETKDGDIVFSDTVSPGGTFSFAGIGGGKLGSRTQVYIDGSHNTEIHTSCSIPIGPGMIVGAFEILSGLSAENNAPLCPLDTPPNPPDTPPNPPDTPPNPPDPPTGGGCEECDGQVSQLTLLYQGDVAVSVEIESHNGDLVYSGTVNPGDTFSFAGVGGSKLGSRVQVYLNGTHHTEIHTSCSIPIGPGMIVGDFEVVSGYSAANNAPLCPVDGNPNDGGDSYSGPCDECKGGVTSATFRNNGPTAAVTVYDTNGNVLFHETVAGGDQFSVQGLEQDGKLGGIEIHIVETIPTSCSDPFAPGVSFGAFEVIEASSKDNGQICSLDPPSSSQNCGKCKGGATTLTFQYDGGSAADIAVLDNKGNVLYNDTVQAGGQFSVNGVQKDNKLREIEIWVGGNLAETIHTSCSIPLSPGTQFGDYTIVAGASKDGGDFCPQP